LWRHRRFGAIRLLEDLDVGELEVGGVIVRRRLDEVKAIARAGLVEDIEGKVTADGNVEDERLGLDERLPVARRNRVVRGGKGPCTGVGILGRKILRDGRTLEEPHANTSVVPEHRVHSSASSGEVRTIGRGGGDLDDAPLVEVGLVEAVRREEVSGFKRCEGRVRVGMLATVKRME